MYVSNEMLRIAKYEETASTIKFEMNSNSSTSICVSPEMTEQGACAFLNRNLSDVCECLRRKSAQIRLKSSHLASQYGEEGLSSREAFSNR